ncbi:MAG: restriction endonuclease subunit S [Pusillimonas sp.]
MSIAAYPKYESYKDSGISWMPKLPGHWSVYRSKFVFKQSKELARKDDIQLSATQSHGVISQADYETIIGRKVTQIQTNLEKRKHVEIDDFVISMRSFQGGLERAKAVGCIRSSYVILKPGPLVSPDFYAYLLKMPQYIQALQLTGNFIRDGQDLNFENFSDVDLFVPPLPEQRIIAAFLNKKCTKLDEAVRIKEKQIRLLREHRQILIQQAVIRGLNPDASMKDSGIDWIGQIPAHWDILPLKFIAKLRSGDTISSEQFANKGYPVFGGNGFRGYTTKKTHSGHFVLIGRQGALCGNVNYAQGEFFASEHAIVVSPKISTNITWLGEIIRCSNLNRLSQSAAQPGLSVEVIGNQRFPLPPIDEQIDISTAIDSRVPKLDSAISIKESQITALKEYKGSLINAAVTGTIKVI